MANSQNGSRAVNDQIFTNLLASAYSMQQRQDHLKSRVPTSKSQELMAAVLETQGLVWHHSVHPETAMQLIASRSQKLCQAAGAAIALVDGENLEYKVAIGIAAGMLGAKILADSSFSFQQLRYQPVIESSTWRDKAIATHLTANSVLSVPIHRKGKLAGCIQLFSRVGQFGEDSVYTCELMSSILNQLIEETELPQNGGKELETILAGTKEAEVQIHTPPSPSVQIPEIAPTAAKILTPGPNGGADTFQSEVAAKSGGRFRAMIYPVLVLVFVAIANVYGRGDSWTLDIATITIMLFTALELIRVCRM
jgi:hypothetical protein